METEQLKQLIDAVSSSELREFHYEENGVAIVMKKEASFPDGRKDTSGMAEEMPESGKNISGTERDEHPVKSPLVGTFYAAPEEGAAPYVQIGDEVKKGQTLAIVEAMKLMNEIECDQDGILTNIYVKNGENVEYGQPLFGIR